LLRTQNVALGNDDGNRTTGQTRRTQHPHGAARGLHRPVPRTVIQRFQKQDNLSALPFAASSLGGIRGVRYCKDCAALARFDGGKIATPKIAAPTNEVHGSHKALPYLALAAGILCIAWSAIFVRWTDMPGPASGFYRMLIPALVVLPTWLFDRHVPRVSLKTLAIIAVGGLFFALDLALYNTSILRTSVANATLFGNNMPIAVGLLSWFFFGRRPPMAFWLGLLCALGGALVIVWADMSRHLSFGSGDAMALGAAACFAVYLMATERVRKTTSTLVFLRLAILSGAIFLLAMNIGLGVSLVVPSGRSWAALLGLGLVSQLGGYFALTYALGHLPATVTSITLLAQVPLTALLGAWLLGEPLSGAQLVGGALVLAGIGLANRLRAPVEEANATLCEAGEHEMETS
jgi:drug/metabolite transporter (DMT)-like permease